ncbi:hypothetical protein [Tenacibaculum jejuense]|uniref:PASTA domain-containing protein n=1 Tax=Tenacibaculum jejuense TaxID=584609 RepID=A0A238U4H9_9FLAO|nr:hypothetical protein [Tenacibaculum jejuense]SNR14111.1 conserved protein of unknown function [Tenacibaculum jejuense]
MSSNSYDYVKDAFAAPLGDFIASIGEGVGEAQAALDEGSLRQTLEIYNSNPDESHETLKMLREVGYQPTFYTIPKTTAKAKISLSISQQNTGIIGQSQRAFRPKMYATPVNASNHNKYNMGLNATAEIQFDIVPVPPSDAQIIRFLPNVIQKEIINDDGEKSNKDRTFGEIRELLLNYGLSYTIQGETEDNPVTDETIFTAQIPSFDPDNKRMIRANDTLVLVM